jgi:hypothetical protein
MSQRKLMLLAFALLAAGTLHAQPTGGRAVLSGIVLDDKARPIDGAEVMLPKVGLRTLSNERGEFRFADLSAGVVDVVVRRLGFRELTETVNVPEAGVVQRDFFLRPVQTLDTIAVTASHAIPSFEENRRIGLGKFLTRAQLEKMEERKMAEILSDVGANVMRNGPRAWVTSPSNRGVRSLSYSLQPTGNCKMLEGREVRLDPERPPPAGYQGCGCFPIVYLDGAVLFNNRKGSLVPDVNSIVPASVEAIEYYKGPAQTPMRYSTLNSECGVLVFHTRRTPGSVLKSKQ